MLRFDGIRQSEEDRTLSAIIPEFSEITADLIADNLLVLHMYNVLVFVYFHLFLPRGLCCRQGRRKLSGRYGGRHTNNFSKNI